MAKSKERVVITKTEKEWKIIDKRIKEFAPKKLKEEKARTTLEFYSRYLNNKIASLIDDYNNCPDCINAFLSEKKKVRQKYLPPLFIEGLTKISEKTEVPISTIVDRVIIQPLLIEKYKLD